VLGANVGFDNRGDSYQSYGMTVNDFATQISTGVQSVTGLNTNNTDPRNPVVRVSVDGTTITGLGTPASPLVASGGGSAWNVFNYNVIVTSTNTDVPAGGECLIMVSEGDVYELRISPYTLDFYVGSYITSRLNNSVLLINMPVISPNDFVVLLSNFADVGYIRFNPQILYGNNLPYPGGTATLTFIP
jgi:hypothetical protein